MLMIKKLAQEDIKDIIFLQKEIVSSLNNKRLFYPANADELEYIIKYTGYAVGLYLNELLIGYATIIFCSRDIQLCEVYNVPNKNKSTTAILDDVAILPQYRGQQYQLLLWNHIVHHFCQKIKYLITSIDPNNIASLKNAYHFEMRIMTQKRMYNNSPRYILLKKL